jgi:Tol biopolymer transport system component
VPTQITPDGKSILFFADFNTATGFDIFLRPLTGDVKPTAIVQGPFNDVECRMSLDGKWLAYASADTGRYEVYVEPYPPTGERRPISTGGGRQPMWSAKGNELFYVTDKGQLYVVAVQAGASFSAGSPRFLFMMPSNTLSVRDSYEPSPDGQRFLVNMLLDTTSPPIYVDMDWASNIKR